MTSNMRVPSSDAPVRLSKEDVDKSYRQEHGVGATILLDQPTNHHEDPLENLSTIANEMVDMTKTKDLLAPTTASHTKKTVRINDVVTFIPLLTSSSFFRQTPKPKTVTNQGYGGMMRSFRIVTPAAISRGHKTTKEDDLVPKSSLWWTKEERREILISNQKASRDFKRYHRAKIREANLIYEKIVMDCSVFEDDKDKDDEIYHFFRNNRLRRRTDDNENMIKNSKKRKRMATTDSIDCDISTIDVGCNINPPSTPTTGETTMYLPDQIRGLEWGVLPDAKRYRKTHARNVLDWQDRLREMKDGIERKRRRNGHDCDQEDRQDNQDCSMSSSDEHVDYNHDHVHGKITRRLSYHQEQQEILLGQKAIISSHRSCVLARMLGKSDAIAATDSVSISTSNLCEKSRTNSPTPSLTSTTDESNSGSDEEDDSESDDDDSDSDDSDSEEDGGASRSHFLYSTVTTNASSMHRRTFRPRMMPPMSWR
ncbi:unnamed protein product [Pseudo-nitzschia multistriata]|uniref:Uncharacterized protein n=1 Tax=Pseudo-nitzschia multistriata TaxID=183589 RepID=A0A448YZS3_9STRA|nr:unnamed protein product [Pseudo-nitzschia multistriata]